MACIQSMRVGGIQHSNTHTHGLKMSNLLGDQVGLLTPSTFAWHRLSPVAAFTSMFIHSSYKWWKWCLFIPATSGENDVYSHQLQVVKMTSIHNSYKSGYRDYEGCIAMPDVQAKSNTGHAFSIKKKKEFFMEVDAVSHCVAVCCPGVAGKREWPQLHVPGVPADPGTGRRAAGRVQAPALPPGTSLR